MRVSKESHRLAHSKHNIRSTVPQFRIVALTDSTQSKGSLRLAAVCQSLVDYIIEREALNVWITVRVGVAPAKAAVNKNVTRTRDAVIGFTDDRLLTAPGIRHSV